jgi:hypothetical protein
VSATELLWHAAQAPDWVGKALILFGLIGFALIAVRWLP